MAQKKRIVWSNYLKARVIDTASKLTAIGATTNVICRILKIEGAERMVSNVMREIYVNQMLSPGCDFYLGKRRRSTWSEAWFTRDPERMIECNYLLKLHTDSEKEFGPAKDGFELAERLEAVYRTYLDLTNSDVASAKIPFIRFYDAVRLQTARRLIFRHCTSCNNDYVDRAASSRSVCFVCGRIALALHATATQGCPASVQEERPTETN
jgi:hypothetical protein